MSMLKIQIDTSYVSTAALDRLSSYNPNESISALVEFLNGINLGAITSNGAITFQIDENPTQGKALLNISGETSVDDAVVLNGITLTAKAITGTTGVWFQAAVDPAVSGAALVSCVNNNPLNSNKISSVTASNASGLVTFTSDEYGIVGNQLTLSGSGTNFAVINFGATGIYIATDGTSSDFTR